MSIDYTSFSDEQNDLEYIKESIPELDGTEDALEHTTFHGKVHDCAAVYLRESPSKNANPVCTLNVGTEVIITDMVNFEDIEWYQVYTASSAEGYIMSQFVEIDE